MTRSPSSDSFPLPILVEISEGAERRTIEFDGTSMLTIGRADDCTITLATGRASRLHAQVVGESGHFTLIDPGSSNGTRVNGEKVDKVALKPGDVIMIGDARIKFGEVPETVPLASSGGGATSRREGPAPAASTEEKREEREPVRPAYVPKRRPFQLVEVLLTVFLCLLLALLAREYSRPQIERTVIQNSGAGSERDSGSDDLKFPSPREKDASDTLALIEDRIRDGQSADEAIEELRQIAELYRGTETATRSAQLAELVGQLARTAESARRVEAERALAPMIREERFAEAMAVFQFLARLTEDADERREWLRRRDQLEGVATGRLRALEGELSRFLEAGLGAEALRALLQVQSRYGGIAAYEEVLPRYLEAGLGNIQAVVRGTASSPELFELDSQAKRAFAECRFRDLVPILHRALGVELATDDRVRILEELVEAHYLDALWQDFVEAVSGKSVEVALSRRDRAQLVRVDEREVELERRVSGERVVQRIAWDRVNPVQRMAFFSAVPLGREATLGLAFLARRGGDPEGFSRALLRLYKRGAEGKALASAVLAQHRGESIPAEGYVEVDGQLMSAEDREKYLVAKREAKEREREAIAQMKRLKKSARVEDVLEWVALLRAQSSFSLADRVLRELVAETDAEMGAEARRLLEDPFLGFVPLRESGDPERRIDFFIMGDGYLVDDDYQTAFLNAARSCEKILFSVDPYKEYQSYFNVTAIHLQSKDEGVDRLPNGGLKDTACDAQIEWGVLTCNPEKVFSHIRNFPEEMARDHQGIVIANDFADVATGGGGVATISKGALVLVQHEVGHSFGGLMDEYDYQPGSNPDRPRPGGRQGNVPVAELRPNLMRGSDREAVLRETYWRNWIEAGEEAWWNNSAVSVFEGGNRQPYEVWRPQMSCMMRDNSGFCVVCMETMIKHIYRRVRPIDELDPEPGEYSLGPKDDRIFQVLPMQPRTHDLEVTWRIVPLGANKPDTEEARPGSTTVREREGDVFTRVARRTDVDGRTLHGAEIRAKDLEPGWYRLKVEVRDTTHWVLEDEDELLVERADWLVEIRAQ